MYDITEIGEMLELYGQPLLAYKAKEEGRGGDGGHFGERHDGETSGPLNVDAAIENMVPGNINNIRTQAAAALITRGQLIEDASWDIISKMKEALGTEAAGWDWSKENADLEWSCYRLVNKKLREQGEDLGHTLPDDLYLRWNEVLGRGERPQICQNRTGSGYHIRTYSFDHKQKEGSDMERPQLKVVAGEDTEQEPPREEIHRSRIPILLSSAQFTDGFTPPDYLVDGVLQRRFLYTLTAKTGDGKTATAMYLAYAVGEGEPIGGHEVEPGHVCMLAGENPDDVRMRWMAMSEHLGFDIKNIKVHFIAGKYDIRKIRLVIDAKAKELGIDFALVIVDTSAAYFPGNEENSNSQLGDHARVLRTLVDIKGGPTVLMTCHPVKNADPENLLPRGGGAFIAEVDGNLVGVKKDNTIEIHWQGKFRGPDFDPIPFELRQINADCLKDSKGRHIPSVMASPLSEAQHSSIRNKARADEDTVLLIMMESPGLSQVDIAKKAGWMNAHGEAQRHRARQAQERLVRHGLLAQDREGLHLTEKGKKTAQRIVK